MSTKKVQAKIMNLFALKKFLYLQVDGKNLRVSANQVYNGDQLIESAIKRNGNIVYITDGSNEVA